MNPILSAGVVIGVLCSAWTFVLGFTGLYKSPSANVVFISVAMAIEIVVLTWGLRRTAAEGRAYGGQILAGTMMAIVGGVIINRVVTALHDRRVSELLRGGRTGLSKRVAKSG